MLIIQVKKSALRDKTMRTTSALTKRISIKAKQLLSKISNIQKVNERNRSSKTTQQSTTAKHPQNSKKSATWTQSWSVKDISSTNKRKRSVRGTFTNTSLLPLTACLRLLPKSGRCQLISTSRGKSNFRK